MAGKPESRKEGEMKRIIRKVIEEDRKRDEEAKRRLAIARKRSRIIKAAQEPVEWFWLVMLLWCPAWTFIVGIATGHLGYAVLGGCMTVISVIVFAELHGSCRRLRPIRWGEFKLDEELEVREK